MGTGDTNDFLLSHDWRFLNKKGAASWWGRTVCFQQLYFNFGSTGVVIRYVKSKIFSWLYPTAEKQEASKAKIPSSAFFQSVKLLLRPRDLSYLLVILVMRQSESMCIVIAEELARKCLDRRLDLHEPGKRPVSQKTKASNLWCTTSLSIGM